MNLNIRDEKIKTYTEEDKVLILLYSKEMSNIKKVLIKRYNIDVEDILTEM